MKKAYIRILFVVAVCMLLAGGSFTVKKGKQTKVEAPENVTESVSNQTEQTEEKKPDLVVTEETLILPGITKNYELLVLSDQHIAIKTHSYINEQLGTTEDRMFYNENGTPASEIFVQWIDYANEKQVDGVLFCGDMIDYYTPTNAQFLKECVDQLTMPYLSVIGNHEMYDPFGYGIPENSPLFATFEGKDINFSYKEFEEFIVVAVRNEGYEVNYDALEGMKQLITGDKPIIVISHVPFYNEQVADLYEKSVSAWGKPLVTGPGALGDTWVTNDFLDMILAEDSPVKAVITGDNHFYYKGQLSDHVTEWVMAPAFGGNGTLFTIKGE